MNKTNLLLTLILLFFSSLCVAQKNSNITVITNVNVLSMESERILNSYTIMIKGNKIFKISPNINIPKEATIIDGTGKYVIPGLIDMHVHIDSTNLIHYIANGITTIRNLNGDESHLKLRKQIIQGDVLGPRIFTTGPLITTPETRWKIKAVPQSEEDARKLVREQKQDGFDFIKVYDGISNVVYKAIIDEANNQKIPVVGHIPKEVNLAEVVNGLKSIEHMEQIVYSFFGFQYDKTKIPNLINLFKNKNIYVCPTLAVQEIFMLNSKGEFAKMLDNDEMIYVDKDIMDWWKYFSNPNNSNNHGGYISRSQEFYQFQLLLTYELFKAGVPLIAGTDSPNPGMVHGFSLHEELRNLVKAGLSPFEALKTATINASNFLGKGNQFGTIKEGMVADLVLLNENPFKDINNVKKQYGIFVNGRWYTKNKLEKLLNEKSKRE